MILDVDGLEYKNFSNLPIEEISQQEEKFAKKHTHTRNPAYQNG